MGKLLQFKGKIGHPVHGFGFKRDPGVHGENNLYAGFHQHPAAKLLGAGSLPDITSNVRYAPSVWNQGQTGCHDDKTEVLTSSGWVRWADYSSGDLLATVNQETKQLEFQAPTELQRFDYKGPLFRIEHASLDFGLTPNHRMFQRRWSEREKTLSKDFTFRTISDLGWYAGILCAPSGFQGTELDRLTIGSRTYSGDDFLALLALVASDGWVGGTASNPNTISFCCFREDRLGMVIDWSSKMELHPLPGRPNVWKWSDPVLAEWLRANLYVGGEYRAPEKRLPELVKCASARQIGHFLKFYGDQSIKQETGQQSFFTSSPYLRDDLQELHLRIGKRSGIQTREPRDVTMADGREILAENCKTAFVVSVWGTDQLSIERKKQIYTEDYAGTVFCATVPNSTLVTRRNGTVLISGNSCTGHGTAGMVTTTFAAHGKSLAAPVLPRLVYCLGRAVDRPSPSTPLQDEGAQPNSIVRALGTWGCAIESEDDGGRTADSPDYTSYLETHVNDDPKLGELEKAGARILVGFNAIADGATDKINQYRAALTGGHCVGEAVDAGSDAFQTYDENQGPLGFTGYEPDHWIFCVDYATVGALRAAGLLPPTWTSLPDTDLLFLHQNSWGKNLWTKSGRFWSTADFVNRGTFNCLVANLGV